VDRVFPLFRAGPISTEILERENQDLQFGLPERPNGTIAVDSYPEIASDATELRRPDEESSITGEERAAFTRISFRQRQLLLTKLRLQRID
jgi:hypothetical protein